MQTKPEHRAFEIEARTAVESMQRAIADVVDEIVGPAGRRLTDVAEGMGIDTKLAWKLTRIVELNDPYSAGLYVPGASGMKIVIKAAKKKGVSGRSVQCLDSAYQAFESVRKVHAGDRRTLDVLLAGLAEEEQERLDVQNRKAAFHANVSLWGVSVSTRLMAFIVRESDHDPDRLQIAHIAGLFGIGRIRRDVPWRVAQLRTEDEAGQHAGHSRSRPIDENVPPGRPPVLASHTSPHAPELVAVPVAGGRAEYRLGDGPIGKRSLFDLVMAEWVGDAGGRYAEEHDRQLSAASRNRTPAERLVLDLVICRNLYGRIDPRSALVSELWGERAPTDHDDPERLPMAERALHVGQGMGPFRHRQIPRHHELMKRVFDARGWDPATFDTYRIDMRYPPAPTVVRMVHPLPERPSG